MEIFGGLMSLQQEGAAGFVFEDDSSEMNVQMTLAVVPVIGTRGLFFICAVELRPCLRCLGGAGSLHCTAVC
jgi:hypothetical protein